jgi:hypothetical protein
MLFFARLFAGGLYVRGFANEPATTSRTVPGHHHYDCRLRLDLSREAISGMPVFAFLGLRF